MRIATGHLAVGAVILALAAGTVGGVVGSLMRSEPSDSASETSSASASGAGTSRAGCDVTAVATKVFPSLVTVEVRGAAGSASGSGSVLDEQGNILTNNHVIEAAATGGDITVDFARGRSQVPAIIVGRDPATDLAVIRTQSGAGSLTPIAVGDSAELKVGQPVVAAGSPLGLNTTITSGIVSALSRHINVGEGVRPAALVNAIQTDAAINPGNSGGPLTDCSGRQVGVNTAGAQLPDGPGGSIGLNFAIPIDFARSVADQIIRTGNVTHPVIGVLGVTVTEEMAAATELSRGALVEQVLPDLGADRAGIQPGDVITAIDDSSVNSVDQMLVAVRTHDPGDTIQVTYTRGNASHDTNVILTEAQ